MDKSDDGDELETYTDLTFEDIIYLNGLGNIQSPSSNNLKSHLSGGYDSGVDCVSCKSSECSVANNDTDETVIGANKSMQFNVNNSEVVVQAEKKQDNDEVGIDILHDPGPITIQTKMEYHSKSIDCPSQYGWLVVFSCFWLNVIQAGIAFCGGILLNVIAEEFGETRSRVSLISSFFNGFLLCSAPFVERLIKVLGLRIVCVSGSFLAAAAFTASIFSPNLNIMITTQGVLAGIGIGLVYFPSIIAPSFYFKENRAVAYGIGICGQGI